MPLFARSVRFYLRVRPICHSGNTRFKTAYFRRAARRPNIMIVYYHFARNAAAVFAFGVIVPWSFAAKLAKRWHAPRRLALFYPLCAVFCFSSFSSLAFLFFRSSSLSVAFFCVCLFCLCVAIYFLLSFTYLLTYFLFLSFPLFIGFLSLLCFVIVASLFLIYI